MTTFKKISQLDESTEKGYVVETIGGVSKKFNLASLAIRFQFDTMPTASTLEGLVVQYIGTTDVLYEKGSFYLSVNNGGGLYSWEKISVGPDDLANLQRQIDTLLTSSDVTDVVGTYAELQNYDTTSLTDNDIVKVLEDSTHDDAESYYRWNATNNAFYYIGSVGAYYTKAEADARFNVASYLSALRTLTIGQTTCVTTVSGAVGLANGGNSKCVIVGDNELYIAHSGNKYEAIDGDSEEYGTGGLVKENDATKYKVSKGATSVEIEKDGDVNVDASGNDVNISADAIKLNGNDVVTANQIGAAGFTNDYNDLDNKPTIPAQCDYIEQLQQQLNKLFVVLSDGVPTLQRYQQGAIGILSNIGKLIFANYTALLKGSNVEINANQFVNILCGGPSQWKWGNNIRIEFDQSNGEYKFRIRKDGNTAPIVDISATGNSVMSFPANLQILAQAVGATMSLVSSGKLQIVNSSTGGIEIIKSNQSIKLNDDGSIDVIAGSGTVRIVGSNGVSIVGGSGGTAITGASLTFNSKAVATFNEIFTTGIISDTKTWIEQADGSYSYVVSNPVTGAIPNSFITEWNTKCGLYGRQSLPNTFNHTTGYFELNGLSDITYEEAIVILAESTQLTMQGNNYPNSRTNLGIRLNSASIARQWQQSNSEVAYWANTSWNLGSTTSSTTFLNGCPHLREIIYSRWSSILGSLTITSCPSLTTIDIVGISNGPAGNLNLTGAPNLSLQSIVGMVNTAQNTNAKTYIVAGNTWTACQNDTTQYTYSEQTYTGIIAYAAAKNITITN